MILTGRNRANRSGVTLVELLVVISIVVLLAAFTIPSMQPAMESRRVRLAARSVRAYLGATQLLAIEKNRPVGVLFERDETEPRACRVLRQVEVPLPYTGDLDYATITLIFDPNSDPNWPNNDNVLSFPTGVIGDPFSPSVGPPLIQSGDVLQLNNQGHRWEITIPDPTNGPPWRVSLESETTANPPATFGNSVVGPVPFKIIRQPVPSAAAPLVLPRGMVIDLNDSGYTNQSPGSVPALTPSNAEDKVDVFAALDTTVNVLNSGIEPSPVMIMFSPGGGIQRVYHSAYGGTDTAGRYASPTTSSIFLMIGKWDRSGEASMLPEDGLHNWQHAENLWLALNPKTGQVTVAEVYADVLIGNTYRPRDVNTSRRYAREAQISRGGR